MNLNQITLPSRDLSKAVPFYQGLGLKLIVDALPRYVRFECPDGESTLSIHHVENLPTGDGIHIYFECEKLDEQVQDLIDKGYHFHEMPTDKSWLWREATLFDPDQNHIILFFGGENRKYPPWRVQ